MQKSMKAMLAAAAVSGLLSGATAFASVTPTAASASPMLQAGVASFSGAFLAHIQKHSCKGKNDCKGQGGCKSGDNGCKGRNSCKGKGGCATDGSPMPH